VKGFSDSLRGYGDETHKKYNFKCQYCGYDGRAFPNWFQLTVDHILPKGHGGSNDDTNKITVCHACNSITSRMGFDATDSLDDIIRKKRERVKDRQSQYFEFWQEHVSRLYLKEWETK
jgi:predicted restriction endonuclease